jgi:hypothetical protein
MRGATQNTSLWPVTNWSALGHAAAAVGVRPEPLDELIRRYQRPLIVFLRAQFPWLNHEAERLVLEFAEDRMLKEGWLKKPDPARGRFRDFLKRSLVRFVQERYRRKDFAKGALPLEELEQEPPAPAPESASFDLDWTKTLLAETLKRMEADCRQPGRDQPQRSRTWEVFRVRLLSPMLENTEPWPYEQVVERFHLRSPAEAFNTLNSAKRIFRRHLVEVVSEYEGDSRAAGEIEDLRVLLASMAGGPSRPTRSAKPASASP